VTAKRDWNPQSYARFRDLRLRPALDLLNRVGALPLSEPPS
jgi:trans-aconitate 2-methyltransferase